MGKEAWYVGDTIGLNIGLDRFHILPCDISTWWLLLYLMSGTMPQAIGPVNLGFDDILLNFDDWLPVLYDVGVWSNISLSVTPEG